VDEAQKPRARQVAVAFPATVPVFEPAFVPVAFVRDVVRTWHPAFVPSSHRPVIVAFVATNGSLPWPTTFVVVVVSCAVHTPRHPVAPRSVVVLRRPSGPEITVARPVLVPRQPASRQSISVVTRPFTV
jgi:hypothetical protein